MQSAPQRWENSKSNFPLRLLNNIHSCWHLAFRTSEPNRCKAVNTSCYKPTKLVFLVTTAIKTSTFEDTGEVCGPFPSSVALANGHCHLISKKFPSPSTSEVNYTSPNLWFLIPNSIFLKYD
jgi:hypothetical protein